MYKNKKGIQLGESITAVMTIILVAVLIIVSVVIFASLQTATRTTNTAGSGVNESVTKTNILATSGATLAAGTYVDGTCGSITLVYNGTVGGTIATANFTQSGCNLKNATSMETFTATTFLVNYPYSYSADTAASNASGTMNVSFGTYPALVGLVGTIIFLALVIGVLVASFAFGGKKGA